MLAPLDNETIFKKAFTNKIVFTQFVKDIFGVQVEVDKIETEKRYEPKAGFIDLAIDIFAETTDHRFIIEIQRIDYDHNFDRFLHYFLQTITEQQKSSKDYTINREVLAVVVLTQPYLINKKTGEAVQDNVMTLDFDLKNLKGDIIKIWGHNLVFLNPHPKYEDENTPARYKDWLDLIRESLKNENEQKTKLSLNLNNEGVAKAVEIIDYTKMTPEERRLVKITEGKKIMKAKTIGKLLKVQKELEQKKEAIVQKDEVIVRKNEVIVQKNEVIVQKDKVIVQKDEELQRQAELIKQLKAQINTKK